MELAALDRPQDTDHHPLGTPLAGEGPSVVPRTAVPPAIGAASVLPEWELPGLSVHLPGVGALDSTVEVLEAEDSQEAGVAEVVAALEALTEEAVGEAAGNRGSRWFKNENAQNFDGGHACFVGSLHVCAAG